MKRTNALAARDDTDDDLKEEFPSVRRLLSPEYKWKLVEEESLLKGDTAKKTFDKAVDHLFGCGSTAGNSQGGCA